MSKTYCGACGDHAPTILGRCASCWGSRPLETALADMALLAREAEEALDADEEIARLTRELEEARERERALRDDLTAAIGHLSALVDLLHHDGYPEHSDRAARLVSAAEIYLESPSREQEVGAATAEIADCRCAPAAPWRSDGATCPDWPGCGNPDWRPATPQEASDG